MVTLVQHDKCGVCTYSLGSLSKQVALVSALAGGTINVVRRDTQSAINNTQTPPYTLFDSYCSCFAKCTLAALNVIIHTN